MNPRHLSTLATSQLIAFILAVHSYALAPITHRQIDQYIATTTMDGFSLDTFLKQSLGMKQGVGSQIQGVMDGDAKSETVWFWLREGGVREDLPVWYLPYLRSVNHFHNPLTDLGFSGIWGTGFLSGDSSITWSQMPRGTQSPGGCYSWTDVRDYFYSALTASDRITRDNNFAQTFRGLGQLMHLVHDLSVPEHTRDDGHYVGETGLAVHYEEWVKDPQNVRIDPEGGEFSIRGTATDPVFFNFSAPSHNPFPLLDLFDTNQYIQTAPDPSRGR